MKDKATPTHMRALEPRLDQLKEFITANGGQLLANTNEYEVLRFKANDGVHVIYRKGTGQLTYGQRSRDAVDCWLQGRPWRGAKSVRRNSSGKRRGVAVQTLLERDGGRCFLCHQPLGEDITVEHLLPIAAGGSHHIANKALAHARCNLKLGHLSIMEKIAMRESHRRALDAAATACNIESSSAPP